MLILFDMIFSIELNFLINSIQFADKYFTHKNSQLKYHWYTTCGMEYEKMPWNSSCYASHIEVGEQVIACSKKIIKKE